MSLGTQAVPAGRYSIVGVVRSEWTKLRTVRSTTWSLVATIIVTIGIGALASYAQGNAYNNSGFIDRASFDATHISLAGLLFGQIAIGVLGILAVTAEYSTGTIRATLSAIPNRPLVLAAKSLVFCALALFVGEVVCFAAFFLGQAILDGSAPSATLSGPGVLRAVVGSGLYLALLGVIALGLGVIIRHTAGAITAFVGVVLILPLVVQALPTSLIDKIWKFLPFSIGQTIGQTNPTTHDFSFPTFSPWAGLAVLACYALSLLVIGGILLQRRDA
jgi:ABC-2 type transport system permease protein